MTDRPYGDAYMAELGRLVGAQTRAAEDFAAQTLLARIGHTGASKATRERLAEEAADKWIAVHEAIDALNAAEYRKKALVPDYRQGL